MCCFFYLYTKFSGSRKLKHFYTSSKRMRGCILRIFTCLNYNGGKLKIRRWFTEASHAAIGAQPYKCALDSTTSKNQPIGNPIAPVILGARFYA